MLTPTISRTFVNSLFVALGPGSYPSALLRVFGEVLHRRRKRRHGRMKNPGLKPPSRLLAGVVLEVCVASGNVVKVRARALFGRLKAIKARVVPLGIGMTVNSSHLERLNARCDATGPPASTR